MRIKLYEKGAPHPPLATLVLPSRTALGRSSPREPVARERGDSPPNDGERGEVTGEGPPIRSVNAPGACLF